MQIIPLKNIPNQAFTVVLNGIIYRISLRTIQGATYMSAWINQQPIFYNQICTPDNWINCYPWTDGNGNFKFDCLKDNYPYYTNFNKSQILKFFTKKEINASA